MTQRMRWLNRSVTKLNAAFQLLIIYIDIDIDIDIDYGAVWQGVLSNNFQCLNNIIHIFTHFFTHMYF